MSDQPVGNTTHSRIVYVVLLFGLLGTASLLGDWLDLRVKAERDRARTDGRGRLTAMAWTLAERCRKIPGWRVRVEDARRRARAGGVGGRSGLGPALGEAFPGAGVWEFNSAGSLVWSSREGPRREREILWQGIVEARKMRLGIAPSSDDRKATGVCRRLFGGLTYVADLAAGRGEPVWIHDRGRTLLSWAILDQPGRVADRSGVWLVIPPAAVPMRAPIQAALRDAPPEIDAALVIRPSRGGWRCMARRGFVVPSRLALRHIVQQTRMADLDTVVDLGAMLPAGDRSANDAWGTWHGVYIPGEDGRFLIVGQSHTRFDGTYGRHRRVIELLHLLLVVLVALVGYRLQWLVEPLAIGLLWQIFGMFVLLTVVPLTLVVLEGLDVGLAARHEAWRNNEVRLRSVLVGLEKNAAEFVNARTRDLGVIEEQLGRLLASGGDLGGMLRPLKSRFGRFEALIFDVQGKQHIINAGGGPSHPPGEFFNVLARHLARLLEVEGGVVPAVLASAPILLSGREAEDLIGRMFWERPEVTKARYEGRDMLIRVRRLSMVGRSAGCSTTGVVSWRFEPASFLAPFVASWTGAVVGQAAEGVPLCVGFMRSNGGFIPAALNRSRTARDLGDAVRQTGSPMTGLCRGVDGRQWMVHIKPLVTIGGYYLVAWLPVSEPGQRRFDTPSLGAWVGAAAPSVLLRGWVRVGQLLCLTVLGSIAFMLPVALLLGRWIVGRVARLQAMVGSIGRGDYSARVSSSADDELGRLAEMFNLMAAGLDERRRMQSFVSDQVLSEVKKSDAESLALGGTRVDAAVLFSHIHEFDALAVRADPNALVGYLNDYFSHMDEVISAHHGSIDKLIGDAVMAVFFAVEGMAHPSTRALAAGVEMLARQQRLQGAANASGVGLTRTDVGIHYGSVISGKVGSRHGLIDFTVIGDTVNSAARLQTFAASRERSGVAVSAEVWQRRPGVVVAVEESSVALKGKAEAMRVFVVEAV